ncbi:histone cluster 1, H4d [Yarrowia lipolytica]|nr:histone cluster 1, H4d [Yarrowia lipolytica]
MKRDEGPHTGSGLGSDILEDHHTCSLVVEDLAAPEIALTLGVERIFTQIYEEGRTMLKMFLENLVEDTVTYAEQAKRKTVTPLDVVYALKRQATGSSSLGLRLEL